MSNRKHRLGILTKHIARWLERNGVSQSVVAQEIVEEFRRIGLDKALQIDDIFFMDTGDVFTDVATNRQKIFRWLGLLDNGAKKSTGRLFLVEQAIVAAMPEDIRLNYLNEVFEDSCMCFSTDSMDRSMSRLDRSRIAESMIKEGSEAQIALLRLGDNPSFEQVENAYRELREAVATHLEVVDLLEEKFPELTGKRKAAEGQEPNRRPFKAL